MVTYEWLYIDNDKVKFGFQEFWFTGKHTYLIDSVQNLHWKSDSKGLICTSSFSFVLQLTNMKDVTF